MIGGGNRIGGKAPPKIGENAPGDAAGAPGARDAQRTRNDGASVRDGFEKGPGKVADPRTGSMGKDGQNLGDLLRLARDNPKAALKVIEGIMAQAKATL